MAPVWKVGNFSIATTDTVSKVVTGVGFQPQGYYLSTINNATASVTGTGNTRFSEGLTDGTRQYAHGVSAFDGSTGTTDTDRGMQTDRVLYIIDEIGTDRGSFAHSAFGADGFTLSTTTAVIANSTVHYIAWAGFDNQYLDVFALPTPAGSLPENFSRTAAGFQPDALWWFSTERTAAGVGTAYSVRQLGWSLASGTQFSTGMRVTSAATSNYTASTAATDAVLLQVNSTGTSQTPEVAIVSHDATGFTASRKVGTGNPYVAVMHFDGGVWAAGTTTPHNAVETFDVTTTGVDPDFVMLMASNITTASRTTPFESGEFALGATDGTNQFASLIHSYNAETVGGGSPTEEYQRTDTSKLWINYDRTAANTYAAVGEIALSSLGSAKFTLSQTDDEPTAVLIGWIAEGTATGGGSSIAAISQHYANAGMR